MKPRHLALLRFLGTYVKEHGYAPSVREMGGGVGISSPSVVSYNLEILRREGYLTKAEYIARGTVLTAKGKAALEGEQG